MQGQAGQVWDRPSQELAPDPHLGLFQLNSHYPPSQTLKTSFLSHSLHLLIEGNSLLQFTPSGCVGLFPYWSTCLSSQVFIPHPSIHPFILPTIRHLPTYLTIHSSVQPVILFSMHLSFTYPSLHSSIVRSSECHDQGWVLETWDAATVVPATEELTAERQCVVV